MTDPITVPRYPETCFLVIARDIADSDRAAALRTEHLDGHLAHVEANWRRYLNAGPIREPGEARLTGSTFLVFAQDEAGARAVMEGDPYFTCGLYKTVEVFAQTLSIGRFIGGKIWDSAESIRDKAAG
ncbi:MAG: YciI family protein [Pseudomonadota bacterium]